jgi:hypothetical protein
MDHPLDRRTPKMTHSLSGTWRYSTDDNPDFARPGLNTKSWPSMRIPQNWFLGGLDHHGVVWYRYEFNFKPKEKYTFLRFDGVDYFADVYLNGQHLGRHAGYFEPFSFDVTGILHPGKNLLAVRVESPYEEPGLNGWHIRKRLVKGILNHHDCRPGGGWETTGQSYNTGGIWNQVSLEEHSAVVIDQVLLRADLGTKKPILHVEVAAQNLARTRQAVIEIRCAPDNFKGKAQIAKFKIELPVGKSVHSLKVPVTDPRLWQPWDRGYPHLYKITTKLSAGKDNDSSTGLFGFRTVKVNEGFRWFVNGQSYFIRGSNYIASQWLSETLFPEAAKSKTHPFGSGVGGDFFTRDVNLAKQANLNLLRVHAHVLPPEFHEACDRAGVLVWQDFPLQWGYTDEPGFQADAERQMYAMVTRLYNHPSIVAWCCHNETPWDAPWMAGSVGGTYDPSQNLDLDTSLEKIARKLDPTRYVHRNSGTGDKHMYPGWYEGHWRDFQTLTGSPFITEYGAQGLPGKESLLRMLPEAGPDAGFTELLRLKNWIESSKKVSPATKFIMKAGFAFFQFMEKRPALKRFSDALMVWAMKKGQTAERSIYQNLPTEEETPPELRPARDVWKAWRFHDMQFMETFENGVKTGASLEEFITNSQTYQSFLIQYGTECFRRAKYTQVTGIVQFDFTDPWPAVTWSVLDYWRVPKLAYDALCLSMQPVLPSFQLPEKVEAGKAALASFRAVNDLTESFPGAICEWRLASEKGDIASATFPVDIPADGVSSEVKLTLPSLGPGKYVFSVSLASGHKTIGENWYEIKVEETEE